MFGRSSQPSGKCNHLPRLYPPSKRLWQGRKTRLLIFDFNLFLLLHSYISRTRSPPLLLTILSLSIFLLVNASPTMISHCACLPFPLHLFTTAPVLPFVNAPSFIYTQYADLRSCALVRFRPDSQPAASCRNRPQCLSSTSTSPPCP